jgi:sn-glycerol 3-phosphate transport system permease protein
MRSARRTACCDRIVKGVRLDFLAFFWIRADATARLSAKASLGKIEPDPYDTPMTRTKHWLYAWLLLAPAMALLGLFTHYPAVANLWHSFYSTPRGARPAVFIGLDHYRHMVEDPIFWQSLSNNLWYALGTIPLSIALALLMAVWVHDRIAGRGLLRLAYFTPTILPMIAVANIWLFFYTPDYGLLEKFLGAFGLPGHNWLGSKSTALPAMMVVAVWKEAGFFMIFYLAALQSMSPHLAEAAAIAGASRWYFFRRVTFPLLMPTTLFVLVNAVINAFRLVDHVVVMTRGGPDNATALLLYYIFETGFRFWDSAYAAALTMVLLVLLGGAALAQFAFLERRTHYQ